MSEKNTGGPAFPVQDSHLNSTKDGMTLRDYFAAKATDSDIAPYMEPDYSVEFVYERPNGRREIGPLRRTREQARYRFADAMLKAREV